MAVLRSKNQPAFSVGIPNYNHAHFLPGVIRSVLEQSYPHFELIVVDDCSTDNSMEVLHEVARQDRRVRVYKNEQNMGVNATTNRLLELATGDYVVFTGADDLMLPGLLEKSAQQLVQHPQAGLCCSFLTIFRHSVDDAFISGPLRVTQPVYLSPDGVARELHRNYFHIIPHTGLVRRSALLELGGFSEQLKGSSDVFVGTAIALRYGLCYVPESLTLFRESPGSYWLSVSSSKDRREVLLRMIDLFKSPRYRDILPRIKRSAFLRGFGAELPRLLLAHPEHLDLVTPSLLRALLASTLRNSVLALMPAWLPQRYRALRDRVFPKRRPFYRPVGAPQGVKL